MHAAERAQGRCTVSHPLLSVPLVGALAIPSRSINALLFFILLPFPLPLNSYVVAPAPVLEVVAFDLIGMPFLWEIALAAEASVARRARDFIISLHTHVCANTTTPSSHPHFFSVMMMRVRFESETFFLAHL